ncbi:hypothetical protein PVAP13_7NG007747 [Panicum virgatum]|uniref:Uncharacterized protein n=1 Tax=Panicum virgatum TaxID=38727 RepID=A0A8T0PX53_PANVG|nr:hypothetical protein PVAP13_7NG007747 [Panicum virgatum]
MVDKYLEWPEIHVDPKWKEDWFYIGNPSSLPEFSLMPPMYFREWVLMNSASSEDQVEELLGLIFYLREMKVTAASVVFNWKQRQIQPLEKRKNFGFQYEGTEDSSRFSTEPVERVQGLRIIRSIFPDQLNVPYVPTVFRSSNPPSQVDVGVFKSDPPIPSSIEAKN